MVDLEYIQTNVERVKERMAACEKEAGNQHPVTLIAAVKYVGIDEINYLHTQCGINDLGENRVQQLLERWDLLEQRETINMHFIGTLQTNKVKYIIDKVCMIHSVDSEQLVKEIDKRAAAKGLVMDILVEINSGHEESKSGVLPQDAEALCLAIQDYPHVRLRGFMTMAPKCANQADYRKYFGETSRLCLDIWKKKLHNIVAPVLSMGMSESYGEAILEGATHVRVGRTLFKRPENEQYSN